MRYLICIGLLMILCFSLVPAYARYVWDGDTSWTGTRNWETHYDPYGSGDPFTYWNPGQAHVQANAWGVSFGTTETKAYAQAHGTRHLKWEPEPGKEQPGPGDTKTVSASGGWESSQYTDAWGEPSTATSDIDFAASLGTSSWNGGPSPKTHINFPPGGPPDIGSSGEYSTSGSFTLVCVYGPTMGGDVNVYYAAWAQAVRICEASAQTNGNIHGSGPS